MTIDPNVIATIGAATLGAISVIFTTYKKGGFEKETAASARHEAAIEALALERMDMRKGYQDRIDSLTKEIDNLWKMFREMQDALLKCQQLHINDAVKIDALEQQIVSQAEQIGVLQKMVRRANGSQ